MTPDENQLLIETRNDVKWLKEFCIEHKQTHTNYLYGLIIAVVAAFIGLFR